MAVPSKASAGDVIAVAEFTIGVLKDILDALGNIKRKIAIGAANQTGAPWTGIGAYYFSGTSDTVLPLHVKHEMVALYDARKTDGPTATGAVGVFGYKLSDGNTLGVMFSVPFDYNLYSNWWNAKVYPAGTPVDKNMYDDLYDNAEFKGDDQWHDKSIGYGYKVTGNMTSSGQCAFQAFFKKE